MIEIFCDSITRFCYCCYCCLRFIYRKPFSLIEMRRTFCWLLSTAQNCFHTSFQLQKQFVIRIMFLQLRLMGRFMFGIISFFDIHFFIFQILLAITPKKKRVFYTIDNNTNMRVSLRIIDCMHVCVFLTNSFGRKWIS